MDLSRAYGSNFGTQPLRTPVPATLDTEDIVPVQMSVDSSSVTSTACTPRDVYSIHLEIGRDDAHLLCMFIAALILSLLFTSRK